MKKLTLFLLLIILSVSQKHNVTQITSKSFIPTLDNSEYSILYVYSSSCGYCQQFTPLYEKLSTNAEFKAKGIQFLKVDEHLFKDELQKYGIFSFPTVLLFWKNHPNYPISFKQERNEANLKAFLDHNTKINEHKIPNPEQMSPYQRIQEKVVLLYDQKQSPSYQVMGLISNRDKFFSWTLIETKDPTSRKIVIGNKQLTGDNITLSEIQTAIRKVFARVHTLGQQPWVRIFLYKQLGIVHINPEDSKKHSNLLNELAKQHQNIVFMDLSSSHPEYKAALKAFTVNNEENIIAVDRKSQAVFVANSSYSKQSLNDFISKVQKYQWPVHKKSQKSTKQQKLTRQNYKQKMSTSQDVLMFLYKRQDKISKNLVDLFNHLKNKLSANQNLLLLRCDVSSNQIEEYLEFSVEKTPKIVFYRNRMKDRPIHFSGTKISEESMIEFIMENTTFDWKDEWGEL